MAEDLKNALPLPYQLENYHTTAILGAGGFGITYHAHHQRLDTAVAIKEYLPHMLNERP